MYEHIRAGLDVLLQARVAEQTVAHQANQRAQYDLAAAEQARATAVQALAVAQQNAVVAQGKLAAALATQETKQGPYDAAVKALVSWEAKEPQEVRGKPPVGWAAWKKKYDELALIAKNAEDELTRAKNATAVADGEVKRLNTEATARSNNVKAREQAIPALKAAYAATAARENQAVGDLSAVQQQIAALEARIAIATGEPPDWVVLSVFGDEEQALVSQLRHERAQRRADRFAAEQQRLVILAAHDATIDALGPLGRQLHTWNNPLYPDPAIAAARLDTLRESALQQRAAPNRADDLSGLTTQLHQAVALLQLSVDSATLVHAQSITALDDASKAVTTILKDGPL